MELQKIPPSAVNPIELRAFARDSMAEKPEKSQQRATWELETGCKQR
jgi:hypothetical protein